MIFNPFNQIDYRTKNLTQIQSVFTYASLWQLDFLWTKRGSIKSIYAIELLPDQVIIYKVQK